MPLWFYVPAVFNNPEREQKLSEISPVRGYLPTLDGWRAISILMVISGHAMESLARTYGDAVAPLMPFLYYGGTGVFIFFGISGVLITSRLLEEQEVRGRISLRGFYIRRFFRILPPVLAFLLVLSVLAGCGLLPVPAIERLRALFFSSNYGPEPVWYLKHTWSLSVEEHFYLFWPCLIVFLGGRRAIGFAISLSLVITVWRIMDIHYSIVPHDVGITNWRSDTTMDCLLMGGVMGCLLHYKKSQERLHRLLKPGTTLIIIATLIGAFVALRYFPRLQHAVRFYQTGAIPLILAGTILHPGQLLGRFLELGWLRWIGRLSYSLYLWQQLFLTPDNAKAASLGWLQAWPISLAAALVCAMASFYLVEKPLIKLGHRIARPVSEGRSDLERSKPA